VQIAYALRRNLAFLLCAALVAAESSGHAAIAMAAETLSGAGSTFSAPLYQQWIKVYQSGHPSVSITYSAVGSDEGVNRFVAGSVDFGATDVVLGGKEIGTVSNGVVMLPATAGMVVLAYNVPGLQGTLKLPRDVYSGIFSGAIRRWDDRRIQQANPGPVLPHRDIAIVARQDGSGTTYAFTAHLAAIDPTWRTRGLGVGKFIEWPAGAMFASGNEGVASRIKISEASIGYVGYEFAKRLGLPMAALQNKAGVFVEPNETAGEIALAEASLNGPEDLDQSIVDPTGARAYPIVTFSWLLLHRHYADPGKIAALRDFVTWGLSSGQAFGKEFGYIPLPNNVVSSASQTLQSIGR
jgi:phosphate transport system substrate-binding protein